ncbi:MAG: hypothetical protein WBX15_07640 [Thermoanaerobaculia bacterium]
MLHSKLIRLGILMVATASLLASGVSAVDRDKAWEIASLLNVCRGDTVAVVGPAPTEFLRAMSRRVGREGRVTVIETDKETVEALGREIELAGLLNVTPVLGSAAHPELPRGVRSIVLYDAYRHLDEKDAFFDAVKSALAPDGEIAVIDWYRRPMKTGPPLAERIASHQMMKQVGRFGFRPVGRHNILPERYFIVFETK